ncbi:MAG: Mut7-C RNAse domain-containing protein [bacterium]
MEPKFIADNMLGRLATWLRILGYDTLYFRNIEDDNLIKLALNENRIILTRDTRLIKRKLVKNFILMQNDLWREQIKELAGKGKIQLDFTSRIFSRCLICNETLLSIEKEKVKGKVPDYVYETQSDFSSCPKCQRMFWQGTHIAEIRKFLQAVSPLLINLQKTPGQ